MGEGIAGVITHELGALVDSSDRPGVVFADELQRQLLAKSEALDGRERRLDEREESVKSLERLLHARTRPLDLPATASVGRNDPCEKRRKVQASKPVFRGTRVPVAAVRRYLQAGKTIQEILDAFPSLTEEDITAAAEASSSSVA